MPSQLECAVRVAAVLAGVAAGLIKTVGVTRCARIGMTVAVTERMSACLTKLLVLCQTSQLSLPHLSLKQAVVLAVALTPLALSGTAAVSSPSLTRGRNTTLAWRWAETNLGAAPWLTVKENTSKINGAFVGSFVYSRFHNPMWTQQVMVLIRLIYFSDQL